MQDRSHWSAKQFVARRKEEGMTPQEKAVFIARAMLRTGILQEKVLEAFAAIHGKGSDYWYLVGVVSEQAYRKGVQNASFSPVH